mmetsp:Transcript_77026/g.225908  ORF Transcript_77026/g.225908 Transcript_77026/m.225908 type:complete len:185 (-) Transcript_77026:169-723(-)
MVQSVLCAVMLPFLMATREESEILSLDMADVDSIRRDAMAERTSEQTNSTRTTVFEMPPVWSRKFTPTKMLGKGGFGEVWLCKLNCRGEYYVAVKQMGATDPSWKNEVKVLMTLAGYNNPEFSYLMHSAGDPPVARRGGSIYLMTEYLNAGDLSNLVGQRREPPFDDPSVLLARWALANLIREC